MKKMFLLLTIGLFLTAVGQTALLAATCRGRAPFNACKNCRYCKHCAKQGGKCGICRH